MKRLGKIAVCLAGGLALNAGLRAASPALTNHLASANHPALANNPVPANNVSSDSPYTAIATRNIFGLNPPTPPEPPPSPEKNLPKITPTGIMGVFGHLQVLFKVAPAATGKPGPAAKETSYILSEGQMQDDIEVVKIDDKNSLVTFDNHGFTQELPLANVSASGGAPPTAGAGGNPATAPGGPAHLGNNAAGGFTTFGGGRGGVNGGGPNGNSAFNGGAPNGANGFGGGMDFNANTQGRVYQPEASTLSKEDSTLLIEVERAKLMNSPNPPYSPAILPTTELTKFNTPDGSAPPAQ